MARRTADGCGDQAVGSRMPDDGRRSDEGIWEVIDYALLGLSNQERGSLSKLPLGTIGWVFHLWDCEWRWK